MPYNLIKLSDFDPESVPFIFIDANIWIASLQNNNFSTTPREYLPYISKFDAIVNLNTYSEPKLIKKLKNQPKIVMTNMLISETINAYLRNIAMKAFLGKDNGNFKKEYREEKYSDYDKQLRTITSDIEALAFSMTFIDDSYSALEPIGLLNEINREVDYNDLYYAKLLGMLGIPIMTHDKDFFFPDVTIITNNNKLLTRR